MYLLFGENMFKRLLINCIILPFMNFALVYGNEIIYQLQVIDESTKEPVIAMNFDYDMQQGSSDLQGQINLKYIEGMSLKLSHVRYGVIEISSPELQNILTQGVLQVKEIIQNMQPITVLAVRPKLHEKESMQLDYQDMLSHDAGSYLTRLPLVSGIKKSGSYGFDPVLRGFKYEQ